MPVIGLTGGIATGKSTVGGLLRARGATLYSADEVAREVTKAGSPALMEIARTFGAEFLRADGELDRKRLGSVVFSNADARRRLEAITHPRIFAGLRERIAKSEALNPSGLIVVEAPLLFEAGMADWFDAVLTVVSRREVALSRLEENRGLSNVEAAARIASQMPLEAKAARSDFVLQNDGSVDELAAGVDRLLPSLLALKKRVPFTGA
jgi:dephospho-CoA kinase